VLAVRLRVASAQVERPVRPSSPLSIRRFGDESSLTGPNDVAPVQPVAGGSAGCPTDGGSEHPKAGRSTIGGEDPSGARWQPLVGAARQRLLLLRTGHDSPDLNRRPLDLEECIPIPATRGLPCFRS
jgi:hypothetical protein